MRYRIERERTDHGYGPGWVILNPEGDVVSDPLTWVQAVDIASGMAYLVSHRP